MHKIIKHLLATYHDWKTTLRDVHLHQFDESGRRSNIYISALFGFSPSNPTWRLCHYY